MIRIKNILTILLSIAFLNTPVFAQNKHPDKTSDLSQKHSVRISLRDAIRAVLKNNVSIAMQEYFSKIKTEEIKQ